MGIFSKHDRMETSGGTWTLESKLDPRWNASGNASGMWSAMAETDKCVEAKKAFLGEPPADLESGFFKY
jgi:hypothetical protein